MQNNAQQNIFYKLTTLKLQRDMEIYNPPTSHLANNKESEWGQHYIQQHIITPECYPSHVLSLQAKLTWRSAPSFYGSPGKWNQDL